MSTSANSGSSGTGLSRRVWVTAAICLGVVAIGSGWYLSPRLAGFTSDDASRSQTVDGSGPQSSPTSASPVNQASAARDEGEQAMATTTFGGGCFWCTEAVFEQMRGVQDVVSGYAGGQTKNPTYEDICSGRTGHAEVVQVTYDPEVTSFAELLEVFFRTHDPTTLNRQGNDTGTQYRSVIYYHDDQQKREAEQIKSELNASGAFSAPLVTEVSPLPKFYLAEDYHQDYYEKNPSESYCAFVVAPKVEKFRKVFRDKLKSPR